MHALPLPLLFLAFFSAVVAHPTSRDAGTITLPLARRQVRQPPFPPSTSTPQTEYALDSSGRPHVPKYDASLNNQLIQVVTAVETGDNQTFPNVVIDTGSAFLWVNAGQTKYTPGYYAIPTGKNFSQGYEGGGVSGPVYLDRVWVGSAVVPSMYVGAASQLAGFSELQDFDGILGLGRNVSNSGDIPGLNATPTFVDSLAHQGKISKRMVGIYLESVTGNETENAGGQMTFGGVDESRFTGDVEYIGQNPDNLLHWAINVTSYSYGDVVIENTTSEALVDTGTLPILLPFTAFFALLNITNGSVIDSGPLAGWLAVSNSTYLLQPLSLTIGSREYAVPVERYLIPEDMYGYYNYSGPDQPTWFASGGFGNANLGQKFLELVYSVFDSDNERIGFARLA